MTDTKNALSLLSAWLRNEDNAENELNDLLEDYELPRLNKFQKVFIPTIGDVLKLVYPWKASIEANYDNMKLLYSALGGHIKNDGNFYPFTFPAGTLLTVRRIHIRGTDRTRDRITFSTAKVRKKQEFSGRFYVKLSEVQSMFCELVPKKIKKVKKPTYLYEAPPINTSTYLTKDTLTDSEYKGFYG